MILKWLRVRKARKIAAKVQRELEEKQQNEELCKTLLQHSDDLKEQFIKAGIHPFSWCNHNGDDDSVSMYGLLNGKLVKGTITKKGGFFIKYVQGV
jgi:hypothetical protein